jgi:MOSC domain-containing protein YiiM
MGAGSGLRTGRVVSVNAGLSREVFWNGRRVTTAIFKEPVAGHLTIQRLGLQGDEQADLTVHGGAKKAVYIYPSEHYGFWKTELNRPSLPWGMFGENLTTEGLLESIVHIEDEFRIGRARLVVTQPRFPCYKLGIKFGAMEMLRQFQASGRSGFYLSVLEEGEVEIGDDIELMSRNNSTPTISEIFMSEPTEG